MKNNYSALYIVLFVFANSQKFTDKLFIKIFLWADLWVDSWYLTEVTTIIAVVFRVGLVFVSLILLIFGIRW